MTTNRSPFRTERNPWLSDEHIHESLFLRGAYVAAIGTVETMLTEIAIAASKVPAYASLKVKFPSRRNDRIDYLRKVACVPGLLHRYATLIEAVLRRFEEALELRDLFAHARQQIYSSLIKHALWEVRLFDFYANGSAIAYRERRITDTELRRLALRAASFSRAVASLHYGARALLPPIA